MKIAIVAPSPVPFGVGGAEKLWWGMLEYFNKHTTHPCELIKLSTRETSFWDLIDGYYQFYTLDLSCFDLVITGKYPGWMVQHKNHHLYMLHCLRGLYDTYPFIDAPLGPWADHPKIAAVLRYLNTRTATISPLFEQLFDLKKDRSVPAEAYEFPGPFIQKIIHFLDQKAMGSIHTFSAISHTVANRTAYFPEKVPVNVIHPPSVLLGFNNSAHHYFFTVSRLDDSKRIELIITAYLKTKTTLPLKIAGTGPLSKTLMQLTKHDPRIEFLGFVNDQELVDYYANAYAIVFVPYDEDYGLITIEAMMSEKPVLTVTDAGGVLEFVTHGETGLVCPPEPDQLAANMDQLADHPELCRKMGKQAKERVQGISWEQSMNRLLSVTSGPVAPEPITPEPITPEPITPEPITPEQMTPEQITPEQMTPEQMTPEQMTPGPGLKKITVAVTYSVYPPRGGGQNRIFYLCKELAKSMTVEIVCLVPESHPPEEQEIAPNLIEIRVPKTPAHGKKEWKMEEAAGIPVTDIALLSLSGQTPQFLEAIKDSALDADLILACQPYTFDLLKDTIKIPLIHDSQNVEYLLKKQMLKQNAGNDKLLETLFTAEKQACEQALFTTVCSQQDADTMAEIYGFDTAKALLVPNGVNLETVCFTPEQEKIRLKRSLGLEDQKIVLFIGSWHQPNIDAVEDIFRLAQKTPDHHYIIVGSVGNLFATREKPANVGFAGVVDDEEKSLYLAVADVALNPMGSGSGTNLKMLDYMAAGIPVVSTKVGARGLDIPPGCIGTCELDAFDQVILHIDQYTDVEKSRAYVQDRFSWDVIAKQFYDALNNTVSP
jgi:glycosyltransferase involved in cell wall biosynthesis